MYQILRRRAASIARRRPLLRGSPSPKPLTPQQKEEKKKKDDEEMKKQEKEAKERVINEEKKQKEESAKKIEDEHDRANDYIAHANEKLVKDKQKPPRKGDKTPEETAQAQKEAALRNEKTKDAGIIKDYKKITDDLQHSEFNSDGTPKSEAQRQADRALAGFLKFLDIFQEILSVLANVFPGGGQVLGVGLRLASAVGKTVSAIQKIEKGAMKAEKFAEKVTQILDMKPGAQVIPGIAGKEMAAVQEKMIKELIKLAGDNIQATEKKIQDNAPTGPSKRPYCRKAYGARGIDLGWIETNGCLIPLRNQRL